MEAVIKTAGEADLKWELVSSPLIEETQTLVSGTVRDKASAKRLSNVCGLCSRSGNENKKISSINSIQTTNFK